jgi:hypothetical protein
MADVTGHLGDQPVELNNAATEATLKSLLSIAKTDSKNLLELARKVLGPDAAGLKEFTENIEKSNENFKELNVQTEEQIQRNIAFAKNVDDVKAGFRSLKDTIGILTSGNATTAQVLKNFEKLPYGIGEVAKGFGMLATYQQQNLDALQKMSSSGVTFAGNLTELRVASAKAFLTLDQFADSVKKNSDIFSSMGGNAQDGVNQFVKIQNKLLSPGSDTQKNLASLGYSAADAADLTASYMRAQGSMNKANLQDTEKVSQGVAQYAQELTALSEMTGQSREAIQKKMDEETAEAQWQAALAAMSPEKAEKMRQGMQMAMAQGGKGAMDAFKSMALGFPPMTQAAQLYTATQQSGVQALKQYNDVANNASISSVEAGAKNRASLAKALAEGKGDMDKMRTALQASGLSGSELATTLADAQKMQTKFMKNGEMMSEKEIRAQLDDEAKKAATTKSQAAAVDEGNKRLQAFNAALLEAISPLISALTPALKYLVPVVATLATAMIALKSIVIAMEMWERVKLAREQGGGMLGMAKSLVGGGGGAGKSGAAGEVLGNVGKAGGGIGAVLTGLAEGLSALGAAAVPVLIGAGVLAGVIAILSAGVAVSMLMIGAALPTLANGFKSFNEINGDNLLKVSLGIGALGLAMAGLGVGLAAGAVGGAIDRILTFATGGGTGGISGVVKEISNSMKDLDVGKLKQFGDGLTNLSNAMTTYGKAVSTIDIAKAERVKELMKGPTAAEQVANAGAKLFTAAADRISTAVTSSNNQEKTGSDLQALNSTMQQMLKYMKDATANTERTYKVIENKKGPIW